VSGLTRKIGDLGHGQLHASGELVAGDAGGELGITGEVLEVTGVELLQQVAGGGVASRGDGFRACEIADRLRGVEGGSGMAT